MLYFLVIWFLQGLCTRGVLGSSKGSFEHQVRSVLLSDYDKNVRPVLGRNPVEVAFGMKISRLVKVVGEVCAPLRQSIKAAVNLHQKRDPAMKMVRYFEGRAESVGHQALTKEAAAYAKEYGLHLQLEYPDPVCVTDEGEVIPGKKDTKEQIVILDTWVVQKWKNEFLVWDSKAFRDMTRVQFLPSEIWVPDISLYNNGDASITLAGGRTKFVTEISVDNEGNCVWSGPATFKANCNLQITSWPFDDQICELGFGSYTYGDKRLDIKLFVDRSGEYTSEYHDCQCPDGLLKVKCAL